MAVEGTGSEMYDCQGEEAVALPQEKTMGDRLRESRESRGLSKAELGSLLGVHEERIDRWENGAAEDLSPDLLIHLCRYFGIGSYLEPGRIHNVTSIRYLRSRRHPSTHSTSLCRCRIRRLRADQRALFAWQQCRSYGPLTDRAYR